MKFVCGKCERVLEFSGADRPSFCAYCGQPIPQLALEATAAYARAAGGNNPTAAELGGPISTVSFITGDPSGSETLPATACGAATPPDVIGGYRIVRRLGSGGMGTVYEAEDTHSGKHVALKVIKPTVAAAPEAIERFRQEGRLASLISHPGCVFVFKADEEAGRPYIVMELMPGATLKDVVTQQGPLPVASAVAKILDVMAGLAEAHELGVIHRDVKPSNCFVLPDGRVKIGDFGLSKFLPPPAPTAGPEHTTAPPPAAGRSPVAEAAALTRTGTFLGTPLFASPEQIKGEPADFRSDAYSVAATLYFLLTGQAPFEGGDATATVARIVSEPAPPLRTLRPDIPVELERIVLKGLERNRDRRYRDLEEFRQELLPYLPSYYRNASRTARFRAAITDTVLLLPVLLLLNHVMEVTRPVSWSDRFAAVVTDALLGLVVLAYFFLTEGLVGASVGKWLMRLRVSSVVPGRVPKRRQLLLRALILYAVVALPGLAALALTGEVRLQWALHGAGLLLILDTMRRGAGYRGLHELPSGTRVVQLPWDWKGKRLTAATPAQAVTCPPQLPRRIGPFAVHGVHQRTPEAVYLTGHDTALDRSVWLVLRPAAGHEQLSPVRREVSRATRLRWLAGGALHVATGPNLAESAWATPTASPNGATDDHPPTAKDDSSKPTHLWDAFLAPIGCPLPDVVTSHGPLPWAEARHILAQIAEEMAAAVADGTLPDRLTPSQVWVQPNRRILLVGVNLDKGAENAGTDGIPANDRAMTLLREAAALLLEGRPRAPGETTERLAAPVPAHAREILDRLTGQRLPVFMNPAEVRAALAANRERPAAVTPRMRLVHLWVLGTLLAPFLIGMLVLGRFYYEIEPTLRVTMQVRRAERVLNWLDDPEDRAGLWQAWVPNERALLLRTRGPFDDLFRRDLAMFSPEVKDALLAGFLKQKLEASLTKDRTELAFLRRSLSKWALGPYMLLTELLGTEPPEGETAGARGAGRNPRRPQPVVAVSSPGWQHHYDELQRAWRHAKGTERNADDRALPVVRDLSPLQLAWITFGLWAAAWVFWALFARGGLTLRLVGLELVRADGRPAARWQFAARALLVWLPVVALLGLSVTVQDRYPDWAVVHWGLWWLAVIALAGYVVLALALPSRSLHDRLTGVYLVPR